MKNFDEDLHKWLDFSIWSYHAKISEQAKRDYESGKISMFEALCEMGKAKDSDIQMLNEAFAVIQNKGDYELVGVSPIASERFFLHLQKKSMKVEICKFYGKSLRVVKTLPEKFPERYLRLRDFLNQKLSDTKK